MTVETNLESITVTVPATTANLGPGFDCLGLALGLYNRITMAAAGSGLAVVVEGEGKAIIPRNEQNLVVQAAERIFRLVGRRPAGVCVHQENNIPVGSGLGSSAATVLGGMLAANALVDGSLHRAEILRLAAEMEGHPDNVAPAGHGGLVLSVPDGERLLVKRFPVTGLRVVVVLPAFDLPTRQARAALPQQVPLADAVFNLGRLGLLLPALATGDYETLAVAMADRLHQPYRMPLVPGMGAAVAAARGAGAAGVAVSGAGPSLVAFAPAGHEAIAAAMQAAFAKAGLPSRTWMLPVDTEGAVIG